MRGAIPHSSNMPSWCGAQLKHSERNRKVDLSWKEETNCCRLLEDYEYTGITVNEIHRN
jgi:hypothetical protein